MTDDDKVKDFNLNIRVGTHGMSHGPSILENKIMVCEYKIKNFELKTVVMHATALILNDKILDKIALRTCGN